MVGEEEEEDIKRGEEESERKDVRFVWLVGLGFL